jgi:hypothetical protein
MTRVVFLCLDRYFFCLGVLAKADFIVTDKGAHSRVVHVFTGIVIVQGAFRMLL